MPRNGSGSFSNPVNFTTEAASPPITIAKLDEQFTDIATALSGSIASNGETNPSANLKMNGFKHTNVGAASALTDYVRLSELVDNDHTYYVDSGSANAYVITPSPAITAYEEGQRFTIRAQNANSAASTLNVNGLGAIAINTVDGTLAASAIVAGGYYDVVYNANATPDCWQLLNPSRVPDITLSSNVPLKNAANTFTAAQTVSAKITGSVANDTEGLSIRGVTGRFSIIGYQVSDGGAILQSLNAAESAYLPLRIISTTLTLDGTLVTPNTSSSEVGYKGLPPVSVSADITIQAALHTGKCLVLTSSANDITLQASTLPPDGSVVVLANATGGVVNLLQGSGVTLTLAGSASTGSRTIAANGVCSILIVNSGAIYVSGPGVG